MKNKNISHETPSTLATTHLSFEYDVSWQDAKKAVRVRTLKD